MPLRKAVLCGKTEIVDFLLESGCLPQAGDCLLHLLATQSWNFERIEIAKLLLEHCPINELDIEGNSPLHLADDILFARFLIENGAAVDQKNNDGKLPYETAADLEVSEFLENEYLKLHPPVTVIKQNFDTGGNTVAATDWANRFSTQLVTIQDLMPTEDSTGNKDWSLSYLVRIEPTRATGIRVKAPADERIESAFTGAEFFSDEIMPCAPAHSAERAIPPKLRTSVTLSKTTIRGVSSSGTRSKISDTST